MRTYARVVSSALMMTAQKSKRNGSGATLVGAGGTIHVLALSIYLT